MRHCFCDSFTLATNPIVREVSCLAGQRANDRLYWANWLNGNMQDEQMKLLDGCLMKCIERAEQTDNGNSGV